MKRLLIVCAVLFVFSCQVGCDSDPDTFEHDPLPRLGNSGLVTIIVGASDRPSQSFHGTWTSAHLPAKLNGFTTQQFTKRYDGFQGRLDLTFGGSDANCVLVEMTDFPERSQTACGNEIRLTFNE